MRNNFSAYFIILLISIILNPNCKDSIIEPEIAQGNLIPLSAGNTWSYVQYAIGYPRLPDSAKVSISDMIDIEYDSQTYKVGVWARYPPHSTEPLDHKWLFWNGPDGLYKMGGISSHDTMITKILYLKNPAVTGESWKVKEIAYHLFNNNFIETGDTITYRCISANESFNTSIGTFQCYKYHWREKFDDVLSHWDHYIYYSPNIGWVGEIIKSSLDNSTIFRIELYEYQIND